MASRLSNLNGVIESVVLCETNRKLYARFLIIIQCNEYNGRYTDLDRPWGLWQVETPGISRQHINVPKAAFTPHEIPLIFK